MNFKYFLRGLGAGIIFTAIIMLAAYMTNGEYKMSDEDIIKKAEALGMVTTEETPIVKDTSSEKDTAEPDVSEDKTEAITSDFDISEAASTESTTTENNDTEDDDTEDNDTEEPDEQPDDTTTEPVDTEIVIATINVQAGMGSYEVAMLLENAGIIDDASDFDSYLIKNGYATQIRIKSQEFNSKMSYEEIAKKLVKEE